MKRDMKEALEECKQYNRMGGLDDTVIKDIAHDHKVNYDELLKLTEEGL